jgi:predicted O-methyltransferase YrrM
MYTLDKEYIEKVLDSTIPSYQLTCKETNNLGFGGLFYSFTRVLRPRHVVVIGAKAGFSPIMFGKALKDNEGYGIGKIDCEETELIEKEQKPFLHFIDPSYSIHRGDQGHWYGLGNWDDESKVKALWEKFGVQDFVTHYKMRSDEYLALNLENKIDLLYVDGDHSYEGVTHDLTQFHDRLSDDAMVMAHDVDPGLEEGGGHRAYKDLAKELYEKVRIPIYPGLAIMRKLTPSN